VKSKSVSIVGLDLGSYSVKCVEMTSSKDETRLLRAAVLPYYPSDPLNDTLSKIWNPVSSMPTKVRISVTGPSLLIRRISLPLMTFNELKGAIRFEAERHIPFPIDDCILDFQILNQTPSKKTMTVLLAAAKRDFIMEKLKLAGTAGIDPELVDVDVFCLANSFEKLGEQSGDAKTYGLLNVGHRGSSFLIVHDKSPFFVREIPVGGLSVTRALAELRSIEDSAADVLKKDRSPDLLADLKIATQKGFETLAEELKQSINYFENEAGEELKNVWISGGGSLSVGAAESLSEDLGFSVAPWSPVKKITLDGVDAKYLDEHAAELNVAFGMVLRGLGQAAK
jgi:type IV pilus assembly protein PilM